MLRFWRLNRGSSVDTKNKQTNKSIPRLNEVAHEKMFVKESDVFNGERSC